MRAWIALVLLLTAGCSGAPTSPTPVQSPTPTPQPTISGIITDTVSGTRVGSFSQQVDRLPVLLPVSFSGYVARQAWITSTSPTVDLIPEAGFDLAFYRQLVRNDLEAPGTLEPLRRLLQPPSLYLHTAGLSDATIAALEHAARTAVYELSAQRLGVVTVERGETVAPERTGWIVVEFTDTDPFAADGRSACGRARVGIPAGHIWMITGRPGCTRPLAHTLAHEVGHAMGFYHVADAGGLMSVARPLSHSGLPSPRERSHAAIAYSRPVGSRDVDIDPSGSSAVAQGRIIAD